MTISELIDKKKGIKTKVLDILTAGEKEQRALTTEEEQTLNDLNTEIESVEGQIIARERELVRQHTAPQMPPVTKRFSLIRAIRAAANNRELEGAEAEIVEAGRAEMRRSGQSCSGQIILPMESRGVIQATVAAQGIENVPTDTLGILEPLRNSLTLVAAGARYMTGLTGDVSIPKYSGGTVGWAGEIAAVADGAGTFSEITLRPKRIGGYIDISKQFLLQDSHSAEAMLQADIIRALSEKVEATLLGGAAGAATTPAGIFNLIPPPATAISDWEDIVAMETGMELNSVRGNLKYLLSPAAKGVLRGLRKDAGSGRFVLENNDIGGIPVLTSNTILADKLILGDWADFIIAQWGGIDLTVDAITRATNGQIRLVINAYFDGMPRRMESFITASAA
jgi:HK97 family phage major capsid protein